MQMGERTVQDGENLSDGHRQQRQAADDSSGRGTVEQRHIPQPGSIHPERLRTGEVHGEFCDEIGPIFDQDQLFLGNALGDHGAGKGSGSGTKFDDRSCCRRYFR